ncbi:FecR family protein [Ferruginibacter sp.]|nr:FecR family protein [Ferruginibacter sp.]
MENKFEHIDDGLLIKYLLREANEEEAEQISQRIADDDVYRRYFEQFKILWESSHNLTAISQKDEHEAWQRFRNRVTSQEQKAQQPRINIFKQIRVAASVIVLLVLGIISFILFAKSDAPKIISFQSLQHAVSKTLPDASVVTLNKNSSISYPEKFTGNKRAVTLQGEAFFSITPDKENPFIIAINNIQVKVVGTSFNINGTGKSTEIVVETGIVLVTKGGRSIELKAGEKITIPAQSDQFTKQAVTDKLYNYYRTKTFVCNNTPLWKLVATLNQAYDTNITISNKNIYNLPITTTFNEEPLESILHIISETLNITVTPKDNQIILH